MAHHHHGHEHQHDQCCSHHHDHCCCCEAGVCEIHHDHQSCHEHESYADRLLELADQAWEEVLKEKIKDQIRSSKTSHIDQLAKLVAESNNERWMQKLAAKKGCQDFREEINAFFTRKK